MRARIGLTILALLGLLFSNTAWSLGLGDARVQSFIGQNLELHIDLLTSPGDDLESVTARLASADDFALIGASREAISVPLNFTVREADGGQGPYIFVTSRLPLNNPVLRLVVEVNWSSGRLLREYTVFLDPPTVPSQAPQPVTPQRTVEPSPPATVEPSQPEPEPITESASAPPPPATSNTSQPEATPEPATTTETPELPSMPGTSSGRQYGPIQNGQTLWRIAVDQMGQSGLDMNQVMLAIQRKNPNAFVNGNINLLKRGATLDLPSESEVAELSTAEAREMVAQQEAAFRMRSQLASDSTPLLASESIAQVSEPAPGQSPLEPASDDEPELSEEPLAEPQSRLEIVPASDSDLENASSGVGNAPGGEGSEEVVAEMREELARTEEALISAQQENVYLQDRIAELESQLETSEGSESEGLVADEGLADLESRLETERLEAVAAPDESENNIPRVMTLDEQDADQPWYSGTMIWIIMIIIVVAAIVGWLFNRRRAVEHYDLDANKPIESVLGHNDEHEDKLRDHDSGQESVMGAIHDEPDQNNEDEAEADGFISSIQTPATPPPSFSTEEDATVLDENSSDPEIQLDLARAYISMGDKEAARSILDEVLNLGSDEQKAEAQAMLDTI